MKQSTYILFAALFLLTNTLFSQYHSASNQNLKFDNEGRALYHKDMIYIKIIKNVSINPSKQENSQNALLRLGILSIDKVFDKYDINSISQAFRQSKNLPEKVKLRLLSSEKELPDLSRIFKIKIQSPNNALSIIRELNEDVNIEYAELVPIDYPLEVPNDTLYSGMQHLPQIMSEEAWDIIKGEDSDSTIVIGISDTGVDWNHPDLTDNLWQNLAEDADGDGKVIEYDDSLKKYILDPGDLNNIDDDGNGFIDDLIGWDFLQGEDEDSQGNDPMDYNNHGTHVAGISAGVTNNNIGIASISWNVKYLPTSHSSPTFKHILRGFEGIVYLAEMGCDIINCSWGGGGYSRANAEAVEYAAELGSILVIAAGNNNSSKLFFPAAYPYVVGVASVNAADAKASYSNYGKYIDVSAPGGEYWSDGGILSSIRNGNYARFQGTSMASPVAAGVFGLLKAYNPDWTNEQLIRQVLGTADDIDNDSLNSNYINMLGTGRVNAYKMLIEKDVTVPKILRLDLANVTPNDSIGNNNKAIEPGESIRLGFTIRNYSPLNGSDEVSFTLSSNDEDIEIIKNIFTSPLIADGFTEIPTEFEIKISDDAISKFVKFTLIAESQDAEIVSGSEMKFEMPITAGGVIIWEGQEGGRGYSGRFINEFLEQQGINALYSTVFPVALVGFDAVFLSFGSIGSGLNSVAMDDNKMLLIKDYLESGGKIYIETCDGFGWDQKDNAEFLAMLGIDSTSDGSSDEKKLDTLLGQDGSIAEDMIYIGSKISSYKSVDIISVKLGAIEAFYEPGYGTAAIQNLGEFGQKSFISIYPLGELIDRTQPNTRYELVKRIMDFLELPMEYTVPSFTYNPKTGHAPMTVNFNEDSYTSSPTVEWQWDFENDNEIDSEEKSPAWTFNKSGDYSTQMTVSNGLPDEENKLLQKTSNQVYVFDGESALNFSNTGRAYVADSTLNITSAFTIEAWIMPNTRGQYNQGRIIDKNKIEFAINYGNRLRLRTLHTSDAVNEVLTTNESLTFSVWQHVAATYDGDSTFKIYINGVEQKLNQNLGPESGTISYNADKDLTIGNRRNNGRAFDGRIDEVRIWDIARSHEDILNTMLYEMSGTEENLMAYWQFEEANGTTSADLSGNERNCVLNSSWRQGWHEGHIKTQPKSMFHCAGDNASLSVKTFYAGDSLLFQWYKDNEPLEDNEKISGTKETQMYIDDVSIDDAGKYYLELTIISSGNVEYSEQATLTIEVEPYITKQPEESVELSPGLSLLLSVEVNGTDLDYQWYKDDTEILNANKAEYYIENVDIDDDGEYYCKAINFCGEVVSNTSIVSILVGIDNDNNSSNILMTAKPNPFNENTEIFINLPKAEYIKLVLIDFLGREIAILADGNYALGKYHFQLNSSDYKLNSGVYYINLTAGNIILTKQIVFLK